MRRCRTGLALVVAIACLTPIAASNAAQDDYLAWSPKQADTIGKSTYQTGQVGRTVDLRVLRRERSYNYKLAATLLTPDVIKATVRLQMLSGRLDEAGARAMTAEAINPAEIVVLVEIDPREGSGVIPDDWIAQLEPSAGKDRTFPAVTGRKTPERRTHPAFQGVRRRDYAYDRFWVAFPLTKDDVSVIPPEASEVQLVVRIYDKVGRVTWSLTPDLRRALR